MERRTFVSTLAASSTAAVLGNQSLQAAEPRPPAR